MQRNKWSHKFVLLKFKTLSIALNAFAVSACAMVPPALNEDFPAISPQSNAIAPPADNAAIRSPVQMSNGTGESQSELKSHLQEHPQFFLLARARGGDRYIVTPPSLGEDLPEIGGSGADLQVGVADVDTLIARGDAAYDAADYKLALATYKQAEVITGVSRNAAQSIRLSYKLGRTATKLSQFDYAIISLDQGLTLLVDVVPKVRESLEPILYQARAEVLRAMGKPQAARKHYQHALKGYRLLGKEILAARVQEEIGSTYVDEANFSEALRSYEEARRLFEEAQSSDIGRLMVNVSSLLTWLGKYEEALDLQTQAEQACNLTQDRICLASSAHARGFTRYYLGDYEAAAQSSIRAEELFGDSQIVERARALNNVGASLVASKQPEKGLVALKRAMSMLKKGGGNAKDKAATLDSIATAYRSQKRFKAAKRLYQEALLLWHVAGHREGERDTLANLGYLSIDLQQVDAAIFYFKLSVNHAQWLRANVGQIEVGYRESLTRRLSPSYQTLAGLLVERGRLAEAQQVVRMLKEQELFEFQLRGGPAGDTRASYNGPEQEGNATYEGIQEHLLVLVRELEQLNSLSSDSLTPNQRTRRAEINSQIAIERGKLERFLANLQAALGGGGRASASVAEAELAGLRKTLKSLGRGAVVLHYIPLEEHLSIILTAPQISVSIPYTVTVGLKELSQTIWTFRERIKARSSDTTSTAQRLYDWLMPPKLQRDLQDAGTSILMLSLSESLRYLPFGALHDGKRWLAEKYSVVIYTDAAGVSLADIPKSQRSVSAFGMTQAVEKFPPLPWVRAEVEAIVGEKGKYGTARFDADFTEDQLHDAVFQQRPSVLHIASHFVFHPGTEEESFLLLGNGRLNLAKFKQWEFVDLDLMTLSACETAVGGGKNLNGREIEGFAALAQEQGADAVLATLWPVADTSTAAFMESFYSTWRSNPKFTKLEALLAAQRAMIHGEITPITAITRLGVRGKVEGVAPLPSANYSHPYFWAPFVLFGNWR